MSICWRILLLLLPVAFSPQALGSFPSPSAVSGAALTRPAISETVTFGYNSIGNITASDENGGGAYTYGTRMPHAVKSANGVNYAYDQNGNMLVRGNQRLSYDPENRLSYVVTSNSYVMFGYDAGGARLWKQSSVTNGLQVWIGGNYEEKNGQILFHVLAGGQTVCTFDKTGTGEFAYYHGDNLHSTAIETDASGNKIQHYEYLAFGGDRFTESATVFPVSRRYTGQVKDEDTGLYFYGARYYDPQLQRFIQGDDRIPDFANPQSYNRYSYVLNNPLRFTDPSGHDPMLGSEVYHAALYAAQNGQDVRAAIDRQLEVNDMAAGMMAATIAGAGVTVVVGATAPEGLPVLGRLGWAAMAGGAGSYVANGTGNEIHGQPFHKNAIPATAIGVGLGVAGQGIAEWVTPQKTTPVAAQAPEPKAGPYSHLEDHPSVGPGKDFTDAQKRNILNAIRARNAGVLRSDESGTQGVAPQQSKKGLRRHHKAPYGSYP